MANNEFKDLARRTPSVKYYIINYLKLQIIHHMINIKEGLLQWFTHFLIIN